MEFDFSTTYSGGINKAIIDPYVSLGMDINTFTIPIEAVTAVKLLFINIPLGVGVDLAFGKSSMEFGMNADISFNTSLPAGIDIGKGSFSIKGGGEADPSFMNLKIMSGIGFVFGPVVIDIPVSYYFLNNGFNVGVSIGVTF
jgi:hypothetical protein